MIISDLNYMKAASDEEVKGALSISIGSFSGVAVGSSPAGLSGTGGAVISITSQPFLGAPTSTTTVIGGSISV